MASKNNSRTNSRVGGTGDEYRRTTKKRRVSMSVEEFMKSKARKSKKK